MIYLKTNSVFSGLCCYISMSEHEGFGIPLLEAFASGLPVFAFKSSAVPETMRGAGVLFNRKDFRILAELIHLVNFRPDIRNKIVEDQRKVLEYYNTFPFREKIQEMIRIVSLEN